MMQIFVHTLHYKKAYLVHPNQSIHTVVNSPTVYTQTSILPSSYHFSCLQNNAIITPITLILGGQIFVRIINGKTIELDIYDFDVCTVKELKNQIYEKEHINVETQHLYAHGKQMENQHVLEDYDLVNESYVFLIVNDSYSDIDEFQIAVQDSTGAKVMVTLPNGNNTSVDDAKEAISSRLHRDISGMSLYHGGRMLANGMASLKDMGIGAGGMISIMAKVK